MIVIGVLSNADRRIESPDAACARRRLRRTAYTARLVASFAQSIPHAAVPQVKRRARSPQSCAGVLPALAANITERRSTLGEDGQIRGNPANSVFS